MCQCQLFVPLPPERAPVWRALSVRRVWCGHWDDAAAGNLRLVADLDVVCFEGAHMPYVIVAVIFAVLYPVGVPLWLLLTLRSLQGQWLGGG